MGHWLITGGGGMLATDLVAVLAAEHPDIEVVAATRDDLDITDPLAVADVIQGADTVINAAAWTNVDAAETEEKAATAVNGDGPAILAEAAAHSGARLLHVSTDYVFPGDATTPYPEDAPTGPVGAYGRSKLAGEQAVLLNLPESGYVVRTAWLYGGTGTSFVRTMIRLAGERETLDVVDDQRGQPTWTMDLARQLVALALADAAPPGIYHGTSSGETTWHGLAQAVFEEIGADPARVRPTTTDKFPRPAPRPAYSVLGHDRWAVAGLAPLRPWREALAAAFASGAFPRS